MNKKYLTISLVILFGIILVSATLTINNSTASISKEILNKYNEKGISNITKSDCIKINQDECEFKMYNATYNLGSHRVLIRYCDSYTQYLNDENKLIDDVTDCLHYTYYTENEIKNLINVKSEEWLESYGKIMIERNNIEETIVKGGSVTLVEEK